MIKVKLTQILESTQALQRLGEKPLRGKLAYKVGKIIQNISNELDLYNRARNELLNKYCVKDDNNELKVDKGGNVQVIKENINAYNEEIKKLNDTEVELNIVLLDLSDFEEIEMTAHDMMQIDWLIKKEEAE